jgi:hypothetical protein
VKKMALFLLVFTKQSGSAPKPTTMLDFLSGQSPNKQTIGYAQKKQLL